MAGNKRKQVLPNSLGACLAVTAAKMRKSRKAFNGADFRGFEITQKSVDFEFDHSLSHFHAKAKKLNRYPGVAQLGARVVWDHQAAGSIPVTRTISSVHNESQVLNTRFSIYKQILKQRNTTSINQLKRRAVCEMP